MGKGLGSGLVMATVRAVLWAVSPELGPAGRGRVGAEFLPRRAEDDDLFVTLFQNKLDLTTKMLHYMDTGHDYKIMRRTKNKLKRLNQRSLPIKIWPEQKFTKKT